MADVSSAHPTRSSDHDEQLAWLLAELTDRAQNGEVIDIDRVCQEHAEFAADLRQLWGAVLVADAAGSVQDLPAMASLEHGSMALPCAFGDFELLEELGRGGMGIVYLARQRSLDRAVAIKMILPGKLASGAELNRFRAEAAAAANLEHPGIVPVYEVGQHDGRDFFCMQFVEGKTLSQELANGPLSSRQAARILKAVCSAIHFAHQRGVLHRDLKPSNILIDQHGQPHVMDFGLAKLVSAGASLTKTGAVLGTPAYMAPEQAAGARGEVGPASDVYSLGTVLYHMLTGWPPFQAASSVDTLLMLLDQEPAPPRLVNPKVDRDLEMITLRCLQKPAELRYASAEALANDLNAYLNDEPVAARSGRITQVLSRLFRETHHAPVLENWGLLWMWHSLALIVASALTNALHLFAVEERWPYLGLWTAGFWAWAGVFWWLRRRTGPVTFVERQIAHVWGASMVAIAFLFLVEIQLRQPVLSLAPTLALITGMVFFIKGGILSGSFYFQSAALFGTAFLMGAFPDFALGIFGIVSAACFFFPGLKYYRQRVRAQS